MSTSVKKKTAKGIRYTDAQKKEVVDFAASYNTANGRGGQSKAADKFGISPLTVSAWLAASGAPKALKKAPKASKATKTSGDSRAGTRYTAEQKQEVVDFVASYNVANGRGGQSTASAKFGISPLTVMAWLKASGTPKPGKKIKGPNALKLPKAPKVAKSASGSRVGNRYTPEQKQDVVNFVAGFNETNGRGGQSAASAKYGISPLTVMAWLKASGAPKPGKKIKAPKPAKGGAKVKTSAVFAAPKVFVGGSFTAKLEALSGLNKQIERAEADLASLKAKFLDLKGSL